MTNDNRTLRAGILRQGTLRHGRAAARRIAGASLAAVTVLGSPLALAQAPEFAQRADSEIAVEVLSGRDREAIHPGDPLRLVGVADEGNDFRAGLHALERGEFVPARLEPGSAYQRQLAMIEGGASPDRPDLLSRSSAPAQRTVRGVRRRHLGETRTEEPGSDTTWIGMTLAAIASVAFMVVHCRSRV